MAGRIYDAQQQQHLLDLQGTHAFGSDPKSWFSGDDIRDTLSSLSAAAATASATGSVDRTLYNDLVEILPLVQSLIDRKANSSFTRRGSMIYTKTPSRDSVYKKATGWSATHPVKRNRDFGERDQCRNSEQNGCSENFSMFSSKAFLNEKEREELTVLRSQVEDLRAQLLEKDELLRLAEVSNSEMATLRLKFEQLKNEASQNELVLKSTQSQLSDAKIKLADKQAAVEKLQWELSKSDGKVGRLQQDLDRLQEEFSDIMSHIQGLTRNDPDSADDCYDFPSFLDEEDESDSKTTMLKLESARESYIAAVEAAKEKQDDESLAAAAAARFYLQSVVLIGA